MLYGRRRVGKTTLLNEFCKGKDTIFYSAEQSNDKLNLEKFSAWVFEFYGAFGGTPLYLQQVEKGKSFEENIKQAFLRETAYLYEEPLLLLRQEVQEPGVYNAIIEAVVAGASKAAEIATKTGEEQAKCLKYIKTLCSLGELPVLFTSIGRWWGTDPASRQQVEIDLIASDGNDYLVCECKWRNTLLEISVLNKLRQRADVFNKNRHETWYYLFSKTSFTSALLEEAKKDGHVVLVDLEQILR